MVTVNRHRSEAPDDIAAFLKEMGWGRLVPYEVHTVNDKGQQEVMTYAEAWYQDADGTGVSAVSDYCSWEQAMAIEFYRFIHMGRK